MENTQLAFFRDSLLNNRGIINDNEPVTNTFSYFVDGKIKNRTYIDHS